jgi:hypothetical protein
LSLGWGEGGVTCGGDWDVGDTGDGRQTCGWDSCFCVDFKSSVLSTILLSILAKFALIEFMLGLLVGCDVLLIVSTEYNEFVMLRPLFIILLVEGIEVEVVGNFQWVT